MDNEVPTDGSPFGDESEETKESDMKLKEKLTDLCKLVIHHFSPLEPLLGR